MCILIQIATLFIACECYICGQMLTVGICSLIAAFASDLREKLRQINEEMVQLRGKQLKSDEVKWLKNKLGEFIEFYSDARELSFMKLCCIIFNFTNTFFQSYILDLQSDSQI